MAWPTLDEVTAWLHMAPGTADEPMIQSALDATIDYGDRRTNHVYSDVDDTLPPPPPVAHQAALMHAGRLYQRRNSMDGTIGMSDVGVVRIGRFDSDIDALYSQLGPMVVG